MQLRLRLERVKEFFNHIISNNEHKGYTVHIINVKNRFLPLLLSPLLFLQASCVCTAHKDLTAKSQEIATIKQELQIKEKTIATLLDRLSLKDQEIGKISDELHTAQKTIEELKSDIEKLREVDVQMEEKKMEADSRIEEAVATSSPEGTPASDLQNTEEQK